MKRMLRMDKKELLSKYDRLDGCTRLNKNKHGEKIFINFGQKK